jgi:hypothetical protein
MAVKIYTVDVMCKKNKIVLTHEHDTEKGTIVVKINGIVVYSYEKNSNIGSIDYFFLEDHNIILARDPSCTVSRPSFIFTSKKGVAIFRPHRIEKINKGDEPLFFEYM